MLEPREKRQSKLGGLPKLVPYPGQWGPWRLLRWVQYAEADLMDL